MGGFFLCQNGHVRYVRQNGHVRYVRHAELVSASHDEIPERIRNAVDFELLFYTTDCHTCYKVFLYERINNQNWNCRNHSD